MLFRIKTDYQFLRVSGCACFPLLRPYSAHELEFRSQECSFLGYFTFHKGHMCFSSSDRLYISKYILFNEVRFPYVDVFTRPKPSGSPTKSLTFSPTLCTLHLFYLTLNSFLHHLLLSLSKMQSVNLLQCQSLLLSLPVQFLRQILLYLNP